MLKYPFSSKYKYFEFHNIPKEPYVQDYRLKSCAQYMKPNFSNEPGCWEVDLMFVKNTIYLVMINVNTRFLIVEPIGNRKVGTLSEEIVNIIVKYDVNIVTIKCDGEKSLLAVKNDIIALRLEDDSVSFVPAIHNIVRESNLRGRDKILEEIINNHNTGILKKILSIYNDEFDVNSIKSWSVYRIKFVVNSSPFALAHKTVDSVIRTLRNSFGANDTKIANNNFMQQMVLYYNNTPHRSLRLRNYNYTDEDETEVKLPGKYIYYTPAQMQNNTDLEWRYIRMMRSKLQEIQQKQKHKGLLTYKKGNIILVHVDYGKTEKKFDKRRRVFNEIATFLAYSNGNVICKLQNNKLAQVPIAYTKKVADNYDKLGTDYKLYFGL